MCENLDENYTNATIADGFHMDLIMFYINSKQLRYLVALSEERNFSRAADLTHISQPALSRSIRALEEELGIKFFDRSASGVVLTMAGELTVRHARYLLKGIDNLVNDIEFIKNCEFQCIKMGIDPHCADTLLPELLIDTFEEYPKIKIQVEISDCESLLQRLMERKIDFAVTNQRHLKSNSKITIQRLSAIDAAFYVRQGHPLLLREHNFKSELLNYPLVSAIAEPFTQEIMRSVLNLSPDEFFFPHVQCVHASTLKTLANRSNSVLLLSTPPLRQYSSGNDLISLNFSDCRPEPIEFGIGYISENASPMLSDIISFLIKR
jgi:DNA-binding transcriptional LysR family regulator